MSAEGVNAKSSAYFVRQYEQSRLKNRPKKGEPEGIEGSLHLKLIKNQFTNNKTN